jgi:cytochrome P450
MAALPPKFDPLHPDVMRDPYPTYKALRERAELARGGPGQWVVSRYRDVAQLVNDPRLGTEAPAEYHEFSLGRGVAAEFRQRIILDRDPPAHTRLRSLMGQAFAPGLVRALTPKIRELVDDLLCQGLDGRTLDAAANLAFPLPVMVLCELLGIPAPDREFVRKRALELSKAFAFFLPEAERAAANQAVTWFRDYIGSLLQSRREQPGGDLLSRMATAQHGDDRFTSEEIIDNAVFLFFAGFETTSNLISTGCELLLSHPDQWARLRADPSLVPSAVEEFLRYDAPVQVKGRVVRAELEVAGQRIRPGRILMLLLGSANRDPEQFPEPDRLDVARQPNRHVAFGGGIHHCLGAALARIEGAAVFEGLLRRTQQIAPAGAVVRRLSPSFRAHESVPMNLVPA